MAKYVLMFEVLNELSAIEQKQGGKIKGTEHYVSLENFVFGFSYPVSKGADLAQKFNSIEQIESFILSRNDIFNIISNYTDVLNIVNLNTDCIEKTIDLKFT